MKRLIIPILIIAMLCSMVPFSAASSSTYTKEEKLLYNLGIIDTLNESPEKAITRIEMLKYVVSTLGLPEGTFANTDTEFEDVKADNDRSGYVSYALKSGVISSGTYFRPNDNILYSEAIKMIISSLGYDVLGQKYGGYPHGYLRVAQILHITDQISLPIDEKVTHSVMVKLLYNAINSELFNEEFYIEGGEINPVYYDGGESLLYQQYGLSVYLAKIGEIEGSKIKIEIIEDKSKKDTGKYNPGQVLTAEAKNGVDILGFEHTLSYIWLDKDDVLYNIELDKDIEIVNGFVDEINKTHKPGAEFDPRYIETVAIKGYEDYIDVAENCEFYFNGKKVTSGGYSYINTFCRAVLYEDEIISMECYNLKQGGMISQVENNTITYSKEENIESKIKDLLSYDEVTVFLNGKETEVWALLPGNIFDYYVNEKENSILIVASSKCVTDVFVSISDNKINFENMEYEISEKYGLYLGDGDKGYTKTKSLYDFLDMTINAYIDYSGSVRYISLYDEKGNNEFYGILTGYNEETSFGEQQISFKLYRIEEGSITEEILPVSERVTYEDGANITDIKFAVDALVTNRSDAVRQAELVYLFKLNGKNEIVMIKRANLFDQCPETGLAITGFSGQSYAYIPSPRIYFRNSDICALYDDDGIVKTKMIKWSDLQYRDATGINVFLYSDVLSSDIDLVLVRGNVETIAENREEVLKYGLLTQKSMVLNPEKDDEQIYKLTVGLQNFTVVKNMQDVKDINTPSFIEYGKCSTIFAENEIKVRNIYDLSKEPSEWILSPEGSDGLHYGVLKKNDNVRLFFEDGKAFYLSTGVTFHERIGGKFFDADVTDLEVGDEIWYIYRHGEIRAVFYNN